MESSSSRPVATRSLNPSTSSTSLRDQYQQLSVSELNGSHPQYAQQPQGEGQAPFFERLGVRGDVKAVQNYVRIVKQQNARLREMEKIHDELETRLKAETKQKELFEAALEQREREWERRLERTLGERDHFRQKMIEERDKVEYLRNQLERKQNDFVQMMHRRVRQQRH
jgi:hypothetical protein